MYRLPMLLKRSYVVKVTRKMMCSRSYVYKLLNNKRFMFLAGCIFITIILAFRRSGFTGEHKYEVFFNVENSELDTHVNEQSDKSNERNHNKDRKLSQTEPDTQNHNDAPLNNDHEDQDTQTNTGKDSQENTVSNQQDENICSDDNRHVSFSECPECFREAVYNNITKLLKKYPPTPIGITNVRKHYFELRKEAFQQLATEYRITPSMSSQKNCPYLLALQMSVLDRQSERDAVRSTWASVAKEQKWPNRHVNAKVKVLFVVADMESSTQENFEKINEESRVHDDILYIAMQDSYRNLTLKILSSFKWVKDFCPCVKFVLKVDQDTFVNIPLLVDTLLTHEEEFDYAIGGNVYASKSPVRRTGSWAVSNVLYPMTTYPLYSSGCSYFLSFKAMAKMAEVAPYLPMLPIEDAFITGVLRLVIKCNMFSFLKAYFPAYKDRTWPPCHMFNDKKIAGTGVDEEKGQIIWNSFLSNGAKC